MNSKIIAKKIMKAHKVKSEKFTDLDITLRQKFMNIENESRDFLDFITNDLYELIFDLEYPIDKIDDSVPEKKSIEQLINDLNSEIKNVAVGVRRIDNLIKTEKNNIIKASVNATKHLNQLNNLDESIDIPEAFEKTLNQLNKLLKLHKGRK